MNFEYFFTHPIQLPFYAWLLSIAGSVAGITTTIKKYLAQLKKH